VLGNRVIIHSISVVLGLGTLVDTPYLARLVVAERASRPLVISVINDIVDYYD